MTIKAWPVPTPGSRPRRIAITSDDIVWYSESGTMPGTVVRFDPRTASFQSWAIPSDGDIVRNTSVTPEGGFVLADSLTHEVTLVTPLK